MRGAVVTGFGVGLPGVAIAAEHDVWVIDQSDTTPDGFVNWLSVNLSIS